MGSSPARKADASCCGDVYKRQTKYVCYWNPVFAEYLAKKRAEGKHYNVALSHAMKKLVRLIYALQKSGKAYLAAA